MLLTQLLDKQIETYITLLCTGIIGFVFLRMSVGYTQKRAYQRYAQNKQKAPSIKSFTLLSKVLFVTAMLLTLFSYWVSSPSFLYLHDSLLLRLLGALLVLFGYLGLKRSFSALAENYSPLFDAYKPHTLSTTDIYSIIRHPIYSFNLCVSFGLAISSGLIIVLICALIGLTFVIKAAFIEEQYLKEQFTNYTEYCSKTWRFIPYIY